MPLTMAPAHHWGDCHEVDLWHRRASVSSLTYSPVEGKRGVVVVVVVVVVMVVVVVVVMVAVVVLVQCTVVVL